jgi:hypothetical protein
MDAPVSPSWDADLTGRVRALFEAVEILSPYAVRIAGHGPLATAQLAGAPMGLPSPAGNAEDQALRSALSSLIYPLAYARAYRGGPPSPDLFNRTVTPDAAFGAELAAANPTRGGWQSHWRVFQLGYGGAVHVQKGEKAMLVQPGQYVFTAGGGARNAMVGDPVEVMVRRDSTTLQPGVYFAFGESLSSDYDFARIARLYFHLPAAEAPRLLAEIGALLNRYFIPWRFKCPLDPSQFDRADGAVLYVARRFLPTVLRLLEPMRSALEPRLSGEVPLFAKALAPGLGAADDPGGGESFGQSRSLLLAEAVIDAWRAGQSDPESRLEALRRRFAGAGLDFESPHLAAGLVDVHHWPEAAAESEAA